MIYTYMSKLFTLTLILLQSILLFFHLHEGEQCKYLSNTFTHFLCKCFGMCKYKSMYYISLVIISSCRSILNWLCVHPKAWFYFFCNGPIIKNFMKSPISSNKNQPFIYINIFVFHLHCFKWSYKSYKCLFLHIMK
jgi:hypothetical protein